MRLEIISNLKHEKTAISIYILFRRINRWNAIEQSILNVSHEAEGHANTVRFDVLAPDTHPDLP